MFFSPILKLVVAISQLIVCVQSWSSPARKVAVKASATNQAIPWFTLRNYVDFNSGSVDSAGRKSPTWKFVAQPIPSQPKTPARESARGAGGARITADKIFSVKTAVESVPWLVAIASWWYTCTTVLPLLLLYGGRVWRSSRIKLPSRNVFFYVAAVAACVGAFAWIVTSPTVTTLLTILFARLRLDVPFFRLKNMVPTWAPHRFMNQRHTPSYLTRFVVEDQYPY